MPLNVDGLPVGDSVEIAISESTQTCAAIQEVLDRVHADASVLTLVFFSPDHDPGEIAATLARRTGSRGIACSSAGELSPAGFTHGSIVAMSLHGRHTRAAAAVFPRLQELSAPAVIGSAQHLARQIGREPDELHPDRHFWLVLFDGLSGREDFLTPYFARHAPRLPIVGGSFADAENFVQATLVSGGRALSGAGCVVLMEYDRPFELIHHTHMKFTESRFKVTETAEGGRILLELDGRPALQVYAEALGVEPSDLTIEVTAHHPFGFRFKGRPFPCSIMRPLDDGLLLAYSTQVGDMLNVLTPGDMLGSSRDVLRGAMQRIRSRGGEPSGALLFNCFGRYLEARYDDTIEPLFEALHQLPICGMNTYGEQFAARHMNHSLTGVVFG